MYIRKAFPRIGGKNESILRQTEAAVLQRRAVRHDLERGAMILYGQRVSNQRQPTVRKPVKGMPR